jgi:hypothetical protein
MKFAVMHPTQRHCELVADFSAEALGLGKPPVMRIGGLTAADQAGLLRDKPQRFLKAWHRGGNRLAAFW